MEFKYKVVKSVEDKDKLLATIREENLLDVIENNGQWAIFYNEPPYVHVPVKRYGYAGRSSYDDYDYGDWVYMAGYGWVNQKTSEGRELKRTQQYYDGIEWD